MTTSLSAPFAAIIARALDGRAPTDADLAAVIEAPAERTAEVAALGLALKRARSGARLSLCAIVNAKSGRCTENCAFCAQSAHHRADAPAHSFRDPAEIAAAARRAGAAGATRFGIVSSGLAPDEADFALLLRAVAAVAAEGLEADASVGVLDAARIRLLRDAGLTRVHHNLEVGRSFFPQICTTHSYDEDVAAVRTALAGGARVCSGGIFGVGEGWDARIELAETLRGLGVDSVPMNFLHPIPGTPCGDRAVLSTHEAVRIVALFRLLLPDAALRVCGGRQDVFPGPAADLALAGGADGVMIGDYLTLKGTAASEDLAALRRLGLEPAVPGSDVPEGGGPGNGRSEWSAREAEK